MLHSLPNPELENSAPLQRNRWAVLDLLVFGLFSLLATAALLLVFTQLPESARVIYAIPIQAVFNITLVGFIALWIRTVRHNSFTEYVHLFRTRVFSTRSLIILGIGLAVAVLIISTRLPSTSDTPLERLLTSTSAVVLFAIFGVAVAPLLEELIFRGFLFKVLWEIGGTKLAIPGSAALFAAPHSLQLAGNWGAVVLIFVVGCILAAVRQRSNSVIPSFIVHTSYNATIFALFAIGKLLERLLQ
jgi:membrane protease YdiL (CAAX protease family)